MRTIRSLVLWLAALALLWLPGTEAQAQSLLVKDINVATGEGNGVPGEVVDLGDGTLIFGARDFDGYWIYTSDGTLAGTQRITDNVEFLSGSDIVVMNGVAYFTGRTAAEGVELWRTNGTEVGTVLVKDILVPGDGFPGNYRVIGNTLYFSATGPSIGKELYKSDGTELGTQLVLDVRPGSFGSNPFNLTDFGGTLFFTASTSAEGNELWKSDGTDLGTEVLDLNSGTGSSFPGGLTVFNGLLWFLADDGTNGKELWSSDGTTLGSSQLLDINAGGGIGGSQLVVSNGLLYFSADDGTNGSEPYTSDGTALGTTKLLEVQAGPGSSFPSGFASAGVSTLFSANDGSNGSELYITDGTGAGTTLVDIQSGAGSSSPSGLTTVGATVFFAADDGSTGRELYTSDGTALGTGPVTDLNPGLPEAFDFFGTLGFSEAGGSFYFKGNDGNSGLELWTSDGTALGTVQLSDTWPGTDGANPRDYVTLGSTLLFAAEDGDSRDLWKSDGTDAGTVRVRDINPGGDAGVESLLAVGGTVYFQADDGTSGPELWKSDGTDPGTTRVADLVGGAAGSSPQTLGAIGSLLIFSADDGSDGRELYKSDGTDPGTQMIDDLNPGAASSTPTYGVELNGYLYFRATNGDGSELWRTDGSTAEMVIDLNPGAGSGFTFDLAAYNGEIYFAGDDGSGIGTELWKTDGTLAGTSLVKDIRPAAGFFASSTPKSFVEMGGLLYFFANDGTNGEELWVTDGTLAGTSMVANVGPGSTGLSGFFSSVLVEAGGTLYFPADGGTFGRELWRSDGTDPGTFMVKDIRPGSDWAFDSFSLIVSSADGKVYFAAEDGTDGIEPWTSDGTLAGTVSLGDVAAGPADSNPTIEGFAAAGGNVFFAATDADHGQELRAVLLPEPATTLSLGVGTLACAWLSRRRARRR